MDIGSFYIYGNVCFASNSSGIRKVSLHTTKDAMSNTNNALITVPAVSGDVTSINISRVVYLDGSTTGTFYITAYQTSGSNLNVYRSFLRAVKFSSNPLLC